MASSRNKAIVVAESVDPLPVASLKPKQENVNITVRVLHSWEVYLPRGGTKPAAIEMILADSQGTKILGRLDQAHIYKHGYLLYEGAVINISDFGLVAATREYRPTAHECKLIVKFRSVITRMPETHVVSPPYTFTRPEFCLDKDFNKDYLVDLIGMYVDHGDETEFHWKGKPSTRMTLNLHNEGFPFTVTLFGEYTTQVKQFVDSGRSSGAVIAVLLCKVGRWTGGTSIQTTQRSSRLLFNPEIPEAMLLRESQAEIVPQLTVSRRGHSQSLEDSFLTFNRHYTLSDIRELLEIDEFVTAASINSIVEGVEWCYWACREDNYKCTKEEDAPGLYYCPKCNTHVERVVRNLLLKLRLYDATEVITVTLFDNAVRMLTGRHADEVYLKWKQDPGKSGYPDEFNRLIGREALWRIKVKREDDEFDRSYKVTRVTFADEVIQKYKNKWSLEPTIEASKQEVLLLEDTPSDGGPPVTKSASGGNKEDVIEKLEDSVCGSNTAADSHPTVDLTNDKDDTPPLKRKTAVDSASSSKAPVKTIKIEK